MKESILAGLEHLEYGCNLLQNNGKKEKKEINMIKQRTCTILFIVVLYLG